MVENKRTLFIRVAAVAEVVLLHYQLIIEFARMRIMAVYATHLLFTDRMTRPHAELGALFGVA